LRRKGEGVENVKTEVVPCPSFSFLFGIWVQGGGVVEEIYSLTQGQIPRPGPHAPSSTFP